MYTCIIIDDDPLSIEILEDYIAKQENLNLLKTFQNPLQALHGFASYEKVDIVFMDIEMPEMNGIELAKLIRNKIDKLVFVTGFNNYAAEAVELNADAYLLKPLPLSKFIQTLQKILIKPLKVADNHFILINHAKPAYKKSKIDCKDIVVLESSGNYVKIHTLMEQILTHQKLSSIYHQLTNQGFIQVHRSFVISTPHVKIIDNNNVVMKNGMKVPIGRNYRPIFFKAFNKN
jgi:DNA-binding LytR/AlgR family response regulator